MSRRARRLAWAVAALLVLASIGGTLAGLYAEYHWFRSLGFEGRFWRLEVAEVAAWLGCFLAAAVTVGWVLHATLRRGGPLQVRRKLGDLEIAEALPEHWVAFAILGAATFTGLLVAGPFSGPLARQVLFAFGSEAWGAADPILGRDPRTYVFYLPLARTLWSVAVATLTWTALGLGAALLLTGRIRATEQGLRVDDFARGRLVAVGVAALVLTAIHFGLSTFETVAGGPVGYAQVHGEIPARRLLAVLALAAAAAVVYGSRTERWKPALTTLAVAALAWPAGLLVYPELIQRFKVEPNELELERPYIAAEIDATRKAFGLETVRRVPYDVVESQPTRAKVRQHTSSLPLWDERPLKATYDQLQGLRAYHLFPDVDVDRYGEGSSREQVAIGVREFAPDRLAASARTWQNLHLRYTHGTGWVVTAVDRATQGGEPAYYVRDIPPRLDSVAPAGLGVREPRVYYGERTTQYVVVPPDSFPRAGRPTGVALTNPFRRAVLAWALGSKNIFLRNPGRGDALLMWRRSVVDRVRRLVPFLLVDSDAYPVVHEGRIKWIVEAYSGSARYPLSQPAEAGGTRVNYVRSVVKGVVDGVTGEVSLYVVEPDDPLLRAYRTVFPELFDPLDAMPGGLRDHLRYPPELFRIQAGVLEAFHMTETDEFYQRQDLWSLGREVYDGRPTPVDPYFLLMPFPEEGTEAFGDSSMASEAGTEGSDAGAPAQEFLLTVPFTPHDRDNLASFLMARNDGDHYGELWLFDLSGQSQVFGPRQVEVQIDQDPVISQQLSLWQQLGSRAIRGHLLLVPIDGFLLYVEPLFLVAEDREGAAPGLKRVIAAAGDRVAMGETLEDALGRLLGEDAAAALIEAPPREEGQAAASPAAASRLERVRSLLRQADAALRDGDLARFGELWSRVRSLAEAPADTAVGLPAAPSDTATAGSP